MKTFIFTKKEQQLLKDIYDIGMMHICDNGCYDEKCQNNSKIQCFTNCKFYEEMNNLWERLENECE